MFCYKCGKEISDSVRFCPHCGTEQNYSQKRIKKSPWKIIRRILLILILIPLALFGLLVLIIAFNEEDDANVSQESPVIQEDPSASQQTIAPPAAEETLPEDGWYTENGDRYYFEDGLMYVELHEIDGELYFFDDEGILAENQNVSYEGDILHAGRNGQIKAITYEAIYGKWSEKSYRFGNNGTSAILELSTDVENCDSFQFYLEANGERGAKVNGDWKVYVRCNGKWEFAKKISYSEPNGTFQITFDSPKTFDAITAHPTVQGNASYTSLFYLQDVHCYL